ncbi:MAG TPA: hypothetical protein PK961_12110 [bacterium]|nr:hypothetical protein [bacterium]
MPLRLLVALTVCCSLLIASTAHAGYWDDDQYVDERTYPEGRGITLALATAMGFGAGFVANGLVLTFYWNPDADKNADVVMMSTVAGFTLGGAIMGMLLPADAYKRVAAANVIFGDEMEFNWSLPCVTSGFEPTSSGAKRFWHANLLQFDF